jgi:hypothetical protein
MRGQGRIFLRGKAVAKCIEYKYISEGECGADCMAMAPNET